MTWTTRGITATVLVLTFCCVMGRLPRGTSADERTTPARKGECPKKGGLAFDVVLEEVDLAGNTLTAKAYCHVVPPSGSTGGVVYAGCTPPGARVARYERLPVMPEAGIKDKGLRPGMRVTLRLDTVKSGALVVIAVESPREPERVGIDSLDAPTSKRGR